MKVYILLCLIFISFSFSSCGKSYISFDTSDCTLFSTNERYAIESAALIDNSGYQYLLFEVKDNKTPKIKLNFITPDTSIYEYRNTIYIGDTFPLHRFIKGKPYTVFIKAFDLKKDYAIDYRLDLDSNSWNKNIIEAYKTYIF